MCSLRWTMDTTETSSFFLSGGAAGVGVTGNDRFRQPLPGSTVFYIFTSAGSGRCRGDYLEIPGGDHRALMSCGVSGRNIIFPFIGEL